MIENGSAYDGRDPAKWFRGFMIAAIISGGVGVYSIYDQYNRGQNPGPASLQYSRLYEEASALEGQLYKEGVLGAECGVFFCSGPEIRKQGDSRVDALGALKNARDQAAAQNIKEDEQSGGFLTRAGSILGPLFLWMTLKEAGVYKKELSEEKKKRDTVRD